MDRCSDCAQWRIVRLGVDDPEHVLLKPLPDDFLYFARSHLNGAISTLDHLNKRISELFWELESVERAIWHVEPGIPVLREVREHVRRALAGWEGDVLPGFDAASLALAKYGTQPAADR